MNYFKAKWKSILTIQVLALGLAALAALFVFQNCGQFKPLAKSIVKGSSLTTASCQLNGISIDHEAMVIRYRSSAPFPIKCFPERRTCNSGSLSGSYVYLTCDSDQSAKSDCPPFNNQILGDGESIEAYSSADGECSKIIRTCIDGVLSGSTEYIYDRCDQDKENMTCILSTPNGTTLLVPFGENILTYRQSSVDSGESCGGSNSQRRTCQVAEIDSRSAVLSGEFQFDSCVGPLQIACDTEVASTNSGFQCNLTGITADILNFYGQWLINGTSESQCINKVSCALSNLSEDINTYSIQLIATDLYGNSYKSNIRDIVNSPSDASIPPSQSSTLQITCKKSSTDANKGSCEVSSPSSYASLDWKIWYGTEFAKVNISVSQCKNQAVCSFPLEENHTYSAKLLATEGGSPEPIISNVSQIIFDPPPDIPKVTCPTDSRFTIACQEEAGGGILVGRTCQITGSDFEDVIGLYAVCGLTDDGAPNWKIYYRVPNGTGALTCTMESGVTGSSCGTAGTLGIPVGEVCEIKNTTNSVLVSGNSYKCERNSTSNPTWSEIVPDEPKKTCSFDPLIWNSLTGLDCNQSVVQGQSTGFPDGIECTIVGASSPEITGKQFKCNGDLAGKGAWQEIGYVEEPPHQIELIFNSDKSVYNNGETMIWKLKASIANGDADSSGKFITISDCKLDGYDSIYKDNVDAPLPATNTTGIIKDFSFNLVCKSSSDKNIFDNGSTVKAFTLSYKVRP